MATRRQAKERTRKKLSMRRMAESHKTGFEPKCYRIPENAKSFVVKKEGVKKFDIIPYVVPEGARNPHGEPSELHTERTFFMHRGIGSDEEDFPCLKKTFGKPCPICDHRKSMMQDDSADQDEVKRLIPKERQLWNVFDYEEPERGVQLWHMSFHLFGKQLMARVKNSDDDDGYEFFADPDEGMILKVGFEEKSFGEGGFPFYDTVSIDFKQRKEPLADELLDKAMILDDLLIEYEYEVLKNIFLQTDPNDGIREPDDEPNEDTNPHTTRTMDSASEPKKERAGEKPSRQRPVQNAETTSTPEKKKASESTSTASPSKRRRKPKKDPTQDQPKASEFGLEVNMPVDSEEHGEDCSIIKISDDETAVYILDASNEKHSVTPDTLAIIKYEDEDEKEKPIEAVNTTKEEETNTSSTDSDEEEWDEEWDEEK